MEATIITSFSQLKRAGKIWALVIIACAGCASSRMTDTKRAGVEQLLISNAIDASLDKLDFDSLSGAAVFVDESYLDCSDDKYVIGSVRQRAFKAGCRLVDTREEADVVLELFSGAVGTDRAEGFIGMPALSVPGPFPVQVPEIKLFSQTTQYGTAKIGVVAYDAKSKRALSSGALARARSNDSNWSVLGIGPFNSGSLNDEYKLTKRLEETDQRVLLSELPVPVSTPEYATYPTPPLYNAPTVITVPGSMQGRTYQPQLPPATGNNNLPRLPTWSASEAASLPRFGPSSQ